MVTRAQLVDAVEHALRAPSVHNTQPWRWRIDHNAIELHADWNRHLPAVVPGEETDATAVDAGDAALFPAIAQRRTDRRRMSHRPVPAELVRSLVDQAAHAGALLVPVSDAAERGRLLALLVDAAHQQAVEPGYAAELRMWSDRLPGCHDGVPAANVAAAPIGTLELSPLRRFPRSGLPQPPQQPGHGADNDAAVLLVATPGDDEFDRLRAGEATSAVLLAATRLGLATTPLSQALETPAAREHLQRDVLRVPEQPQLVIRVGWPATGAAEIPSTPRRSLAHVLRN
jgi:nitroreductase